MFQFKNEGTAKQFLGCNHGLFLFCCSFSSQRSCMFLYYFIVQKLDFVMLMNILCFIKVCKLFSQDFLSNLITSLDLQLYII